MQASNTHVAAVCHGDGHHVSQIETCSSKNEMSLRHASKCTHKGPRVGLQSPGGQRVPRPARRGQMVERQGRWRSTS